MALENSELILAFIPILIYAVQGAIKAKKDGKAFDPHSFISTLVIGGISVGVISSQTGDLVLLMAPIFVSSLLLDKLYNAIVGYIKK